MPSIKVMHIITRLDWGGSAQNTLITALGQAGSRFSPLMAIGSTAAASDHGGATAVAENRRRLSEARIPCMQIDTLTRTPHPIKDLLALRTLLALLRRERPQIVHTHTSKAGVLGRIAARLAGVPIVVHTSHGHVFYGHFGPIPSQFFLALERVLAARTDRLIALTEAERDEHLAIGVGTPDQFAVIPSGIDLARFRRVRDLPRQAERVACSPDAVVVGSVGWLTPVKGHHIFIQALARLRNTHPDLHGVVIGTGDRLAELTAMATQHGLRDRVHFLGHRPDIPECLAAMDVFVLPSLNEGMGRALVEAMAAGRPVVASRVGGIPAIVAHEKTGLLVPPGDAPALARAIGSLLARPHRAKELAVAAAESIRERYSVEAMVRHIEEVYDDAIRYVLSAS